MKQGNKTAAGKQSSKHMAARGDAAGSGNADTALGAGLRDFSPEEQHRLIAEAAYFRALERGFTPGCEMDDWLQAEAEINQILHMPKTKPL